MDTMDKSDGKWSGQLNFNDYSDLPKAKLNQQASKQDTEQLANNKDWWRLIMRSSGSTVVGNSQSCITLSFAVGDITAKLIKKPVI